MAASRHLLDSLFEDVDVAYREVRSLVLDQFPPGAQPDPRKLNTAQLLALDRLERAENALADYRAQMYRAWSPSLPATR